MTLLCPVMLPKVTPLTRLHDRKRCPVTAPIAIANAVLEQL
jgi:hypothetical protein